LTRQLDRKLGFASVFSISIAAGIAGVFVLPGLAAGLVGPWASLVFILAGLMVLPALLSKAELATAMPVAGGTYVYVDRAMGPLMGMITGLGTWVSLSAKTAFALVGLGAYVALVADPVWIKPISITVLGVLLLVNVIGVGKASMLQTSIVAVCLVGLTVFAAWGATTIDSSHFEPAFPKGLSGVAIGTAFVFTAYAGVTKVCSVAEEVRRPERNIPLGMIIAHVTSMVFFAFVAWAVVGNADLSVLSTSAVPVAEAASNIGGRPFVVVMSVVAVLGLISMSNAGILAASRYPFAMGRDRMLPGWSHDLSPRFATPVTAILLTGGILLLLVAFLPVVKLAKLASAFKIVVFTLANLAVILLRESHARWYRPSFRSPLYPWIQVLGIAGGIALLSTLGWFALSGVLGVVLVGAAWYFGYVRSRVGRKGAFAHLWGEAHVLKATVAAEQAEERGYQPPRVLTPLFGAEQDPERLIQLAGTFVEEGWLEVLRLEELPAQTMLVASLGDDPRGREIADAAYEVGRQLDVRVAFHDILTHNAKRAVSEHAVKTRADWIVMQWPRQGQLSSLVRNHQAWWLDHAPCDLALLRDRGEEQWRRILVLAKPGPYDSLVIHVADRLARRTMGRLTLLRPVADVTTQAQIAGHRRYHEQLRELCHSPTDSLILRTSDVEATVTEVSSDYDLLVMGADAERSLATLFFHNDEQRIGRAAHCSVLMVKAPRASVHSRFNLPPGSPFPFGRSLAAFITRAAVGHRLPVARKDELLDLIAEQLAAGLGVDLASEIASKLRKRERQQPTGLPGGLALVGATKNGLPATSLGVFTLVKPIPWGGRATDRVDVVLVVMSPHEQRQAQLWMLGRLARMIQHEGFVDQVRGAGSETELLEALADADRAIDRYLSGMDTAGELSPARADTSDPLDGSR
jgi:basic amino acid/polyamine antiporter, APA family